MLDEANCFDHHCLYKQDKLLGIVHSEVSASLETDDTVRALYLDQYASKLEA